MIDHDRLPFMDTLLYLIRDFVRDFVRPLRRGGPLWADLNARGATDAGNYMCKGCDIFNCLVSIIYK